MLQWGPVKSQGSHWGSQKRETSENVAINRVQKGGETKSPDMKKGGDGSGFSSRLTGEKLEKRSATVGKGKGKRLEKKPTFNCAEILKGRPELVCKGEETRLLEAITSRNGRLSEAIRSLKNPGT